ncbi:GlxA family transcriptional regulator [Reinekea blandensis]|uniref:HTH araC/xylS-type domain-containing protein n=1 Tax=Reinekea blandensis MED297 TaxID=314283 RepID=A4BFF7_9GAMM|nr:helix-turn-helix domain-containing protein [Reinekea blandensis]EAR09052.1 hypothetical protein MED297_16958 [Reinekea sp. MED297] [Reinekea blandensis MED297]
MKLAFLLYPQILTTGVSIPVEMFHAADQAVGHLAGQGVQVYFVAERIGPVSLTAGIELVAQSDFAKPLDVDFVFCPPMWGSPWQSFTRQRQAQNWLRAQYQQGSRLVATGSGVGMVAEAGLLDGRVATTHWYYLERFRQRFSSVNFQTEHFITHEDGIYCAGSINAQTDLVLYFIEREFGEEALALVERQFMHEIKRDFSTPFYEPGGAVHDDEIVSLVQSWVRSHLNEPISLAQLAAVAGQSERQIRRRFSEATKESPMQYVQKVRLEEARALLRETNLSVTEIASSCGFTGVAYFARVFRQSTGMSAGEYRQMVRKKLFSDL